MGAAESETASETGWTPVPDPEGQYSSGIPDLDRLIGGGYPRGGHALFNVDSTVGPEDEDLVFMPLYLNFLYQSRGMLAVLPSRDTPHGFRARVTRHASRRRFDSRVRVIVYVDEDIDAPYVVYLPSSGPKKGKAFEKRRSESMEKMVAAEKAARGERGRTILEVNSFEVVETVVGAETATKMFLHGTKRARQVGNLVLGRLRPGLGCAEAVRGMADMEFDLHRDDVGLTIRGVRPRFPPHVVVPDRSLGRPHASLVPSP